MAIECGFFNSVNGDRKYNAEDMSRYFEHILSSGLFEHIEKCMLVTAVGGMEIAVAPGAGLIDCHWFRMKTTASLTIGTANAALPRIDAVVLRMDTSDSVRAITLDVIAGTPAESPVAYAPQKSETSAEIVIAHVYVPAAASAITAENITDTREDENICGWVHSLVSLTDAPLLRRVSCQHTAATNGATIFPITAAAYIPAADTVNVYVNGFYMTADVDYTVNRDNNTVVLTVGVDAGTLVTIEVYKSISPEHVPEAVETFAALVDDVTALKASAHNLLDNSDFTNPVNQRGYASGNTVGYEKFFLDRWMSLTNPALAYTLTASGLGLPNNSVILQTVSGIEAGENLTFAVWLSDGNFAVATATAAYNTDGTWAGLASVTGGAVELAVDSIRGNIQAIIYAKSDITVMHAALYKGAFTADNLPEYVPKGYGAELSECQRYYIRFPAASGVAFCGYAPDASTARVTIPLPIAMRSTEPSFDVGDRANMVLYPGGVTPSVINSITTHNAVAVMEMAASGLTALAPLVLTPNTYIELRCDL